MTKNLLKIGGLAVSIVGVGVSLASDYIGKKQLSNDIVSSKEFQDLLKKTVEETLNNN